MSKSMKKISALIILITILSISIIHAQGNLTCDPTADPPEICNGQSSQLTALASGGTGTYSYEWTSDPPGFYSLLANPVVNPSVTTIYMLKVFDDFSSDTGFVTVNVQPLPVPEAGPDQVIPYGTTATLQGNASGGSGNYLYHWEPEEMLLNPDSQNPTSVIINQSTMFSLTVTDATTACVCSSLDYMSVIVAGEPLAVAPVADPPSVCTGNSSLLHANASGGAGMYDYFWTSDPPGFFSNLSDPEVTPQTTTKYYIQVSDQYNMVRDSVVVTVYNTELDILAGPDMQLCQNGEADMKVYVLSGEYPFSYTWYFQGEPVGNDSVYHVSWAEYGMYAPNTLTFNCFVTDNCGNTDNDEVNVTFFPLVEISGSPLICPGDTNQLICSPAQLYEWHLDSPAGPVISNNQILYFSPAVPGYHTVCVSILNDCGEFADTCFTFEVAIDPLVDFGFTDTTLCVVDSIVLDAGNPFCTYLWSTGSTEQMITAFSSEPYFEIQTISVTVTNPSGCSSIGECTIIFDNTACEFDTMSYFSPGEDTLYDYIRRGYCGYVSGTNCDQDKIKANFYSDPVKSYEMEKVLLRFGKAVKTSPAEVPVKIGIWTGQEKAAGPGMLIDSAFVALSRIIQDISGGILTTVVFNSPVAAPKDFYIGVFLPQNIGDTLALMTDTDGASEAGIAWTLNAQNEWIPYSADPRFMMNVSNAIFPVVSQNNSGYYEPPENTTEYDIYPNPVNSILHIVSKNDHPTPAELIVLDLQGRTVLRDIFTGKTSLNLRSLDQGIYVIGIKEGNKSGNYKVVVY